MSWLSKVTSAVFSLPEDTPAREIIPVEAQWARHKLGLHLHDSGKSEFDRFIKASDFLDAVERVGDRHPFGSLVMTGAQARVGARIALMDAVLGHKCPFFFEDKGDDQPVFVEDMYVPVKHLATHGLWLLDKVKSTLAAGVYGDALEESQEKFLYRFDLTYADEPMVFVEKDKVDEVFIATEACRPVQGLQRALMPRPPEVA
ncbi:MAG: hypothetical protein ACK4NR_05115 [Micavibrio sp.]